MKEQSKNGGSVATTRVVREIAFVPALVHCSSVVLREAGERAAELVCVWYEGRYEAASDTVIRIARRAVAPAGEASNGWDESRVAIDLPGSPVGNPVVFGEGAGRIRMLFSLLMSESWTNGIICTVFSDDGGRSWSPPSLFVPRPGYVPKTRPVQNRHGTWVVPLYHEEMYAPFVAPADSFDDPSSVSLVAEVMARGKVIQPAVVLLEDGTLLMFARSNQGAVWAGRSVNQGYSWSLLRPTVIPNPDSAVELIRLSNGELLLVWNSSSLSRGVLSVALSRDEGESWYCSREIARGGGEYSYPSACELADGGVSVTYTHDRYQILETELNLSWIRENPLEKPIQTTHSLSTAVRGVPAGEEQ